ncbi:hypothetical protein [Flavobacterium luteolum]|uniref:DUF7738 domain-containing protein n=1 Tax=Flavobacterium luteolum TaxID=3003259 RepID=UPI00248DBC0E|nr:hypothetical protein [Flavobacterium luteolum]
MPETDFYISEHNITYKKQELPFGKPVTEWVKVFGKYDRVNPPLGKEGVVRRDYIWDNLGLAVEEHGEDGKKKIIPDFYIFFMNLDSPLGQMGKLKEAKGRVSVAFIKEKDKRTGWFTSDADYVEMEKRITIGSDAPQNFIYPFKIYSKSLNIEGAEVKEGMKVSDINKKRMAADLPVIKYWDADMNNKHEDGSTTTLSNGYFTSFNGFSSPEEQTKADFYNIMYRQTEGEIEYIHIVHDKGQEYFKF